jgi:integrase
VKSLTRDGRTSICKIIPSALWSSYLSICLLGQKNVVEMAPTKSNGRVLPITDLTKPCFERSLAIQERRKELISAAGTAYYDNDLLVSKPDGAPYHRDAISTTFGRLIRHLEMPHIRFHV